MFYSLIKYWLELDLDLNEDISSFDPLRPDTVLVEFSLSLGHFI